jgi:alkylated DNA repair protein (DNA oxidative demethylase)
MARPYSLPLAFDEPERPITREALGPQATLLAGFAQHQAGVLLAALESICCVSPLRHMTTPGGWAMSVAMTNCGVAGWVTDRSGYRYDSIDPQTGRAWPAMPAAFAALADRAAAAGGFAGFRPDACLINQYRPGARLSLHQDRNERDLSFPVVSVSLGLPAVFLWGGQKRNDRYTRVPLLHGDVVVWGGIDRLRFHAVQRLADGEHPLTGAFRYNLTFRKAR